MDSEICRKFGVCVWSLYLPRHRP